MNPLLRAAFLSVGVSFPSPWPGLAPIGAQQTTEIPLLVTASSRRAVEAREQRRKVKVAPMSPGALPAIDIRNTCRTSSYISGAASDKGVYDACLSSEQTARESIVKQWKQFPDIERAACIRPGVYLPSYVEWLTCLELQRDVRNLEHK
jgi:hypothetical protein